MKTHYLIALLALASCKSSSAEVYGTWRNIPTPPERYFQPINLLGHEMNNILAFVHHKYLWRPGGLIFDRDGRYYSYWVGLPQSNLAGSLVMPTVTEDLRPDTISLHFAYNGRFFVLGDTLLMMKHRNPTDVVFEFPAAEVNYVEIHGDTMLMRYYERVLNRADTAWFERVPDLR